MLLAVLGEEALGAIGGQGVGSTLEGLAGGGESVDGPDMETEAGVVHAFNQIGGDKLGVEMAVDTVGLDAFEDADEVG